MFKHNILKVWSNNKKAFNTTDEMVSFVLKKINKNEMHPCKSSCAGLCKQIIHIKNVIKFSTQCFWGKKYENLLTSMFYFE